MRVFQGRPCSLISASISASSMARGPASDKAQDSCVPPDPSPAVLPAHRWMLPLAIFISWAGQAPGASSLFPASYPCSLVLPTAGACRDCSWLLLAAPSAPLASFSGHGHVLLLFAGRAVATSLLALKAAMAPALSGPSLTSLLETWAQARAAFPVGLAVPCL